MLGTGGCARPLQGEPFDDRTPIYQQIADRIRNAVLVGDIPEGAQVMSTTQYATTYRINPATAAKVMNELVDEGLLHKRRGVGMFVSEGAGELLRRERRATFWEDTFGPVLDEARALGITTDQLIAHPSRSSRDQAARRRDRRRHPPLPGRRSAL